MKSSSQGRLAIVCGVPAPYHSALFQRLAEHPHVDLRVFHSSLWHDNVGWHSVDVATLPYPHEILPKSAPTGWRRPALGLVNRSISKRLRAFRPDAVLVFGYNQLTCWRSFLYCLRRRVPFALRGDSNPHLDTSTTMRARLRRRWLRWLIRRADCLFAVGSANADYWRRYGARDDQIRLAPFAVDNQAVARLATPRSQVPGHTRFLSIGRLVPRKGIDTLLEAFCRLCRTGAAVQLTIVGDGPDRPRLVRLARPETRSQLHWAGHLAHHEAMCRFADADVFVLPSRHEPWGLVLNEALAAGVPVLADARCGAAIDLVDQNETGWKLSPMNADTLFAAMLRCTRQREHLPIMGQKGRRKVEEFSLERCAEVIAAWLIAKRAGD